MNAMNVFALIAGIVSAATICIAILWDAIARLTERRRRGRQPCICDAITSTKTEEAAAAALMEPREAARLP